MGVTTYLQTYFAIECSRSAFFISTGTNKTVCPLYGIEHEVRNNAKFCDQCGSKTLLETTEEPTEAFKNFCVKFRYISPEKVFIPLMEGDLVWSSSTGSYKIGWYKLQAGTHCDTKIEDSIMGLGIQLSNICCESDVASRVLAYSSEDFVKLTKLLQEIATVFGFITPPKLYTQVYISY
jgi:hypothetical protein